MKLTFWSINLYEIKEKTSITLKQHDVGVWSMNCILCHFQSIHCEISKQHKLLVKISPITYRHDRRQIAQCPSNAWSKVSLSTPTHRYIYICLYLSTTLKETMWSMFIVRFERGIWSNDTQKDFRKFRLAIIN